MAEAAHSSYSASGFEAAMLCPGKPVMEQGKPNNSNIYSATGTVAHMLLEFALRDGAQPAGYLGRVFPVEGFDIEVDDDMVEAVDTALANIREMAGDAAILSEQRVNYSKYLQVPFDEAWGTADVIVPRGEELQVHDYKNGSGVPVDAERNPQMMLYGLGALEAVNDLMGPFKTVRLVIHQPNIKEAPSEWSCSVEDLEHWALTEAGDAVDQRQMAASETPTGAAPATESAWFKTFLNPGEKQCKFCKAKATCPALRAEVAAAVGLEIDAASPDEFAEAPLASPTADSDADWLSASMKKADLVEGWVTAVRAETERRLLAGSEVPDFKLVQGKKGNRRWANAAEAEKAMKSMRLSTEQMYTLKLISPTTAEKLAPDYDKAGKVKPPKEGAPKPVIGPRQWPTLQAMITQPPGKPHVAPVSDSRPALVITPVVDDFADVTTDSDLA
jgi:hypothetical protein